MTQRVKDIARGLSALTALALLVLGIPVALILAVGSPLPAGVPSLSGIEEAFSRGGIDDAVVVKSLAVLLWLAWAQIAVAFAVEIVAVARGRSPRRAMALPGIQVAVGRLIGTAVLLATIVPASRSAAMSPRPIAISAVAPVEAPVLPPPGRPETPSTALPDSGSSSAYVVQRHDSLWAIAERTLGDGFRWQEIRDLNVGQSMPDGEVLTFATETIQPGWVLRLPADAERTGEGDVTRSATPPGSPETVIVEPGEHLWSIAESTLNDRLGKPPGSEEIREHWERIIESNSGQLADAADPGLVFAGQEIVIPADGGAADQPVPEPEAADPLPPAAPVPTPTTSLPAARPEASSSRQPAMDAGDAAADTLPAGMFGVAGATIAVGIGAALLRRRRRRLLRLPSGAAPPTPPSELDDVRRQLLIAGDEEQVASLVGAMGEIAAELARRNSPARPRIVQAGSSAIEVLLSATSLPAGIGWRAEGGGSVWVHDGLAERPSADVGGMTSPVLVAVGVGEEAGQLYIDLEAEATVSIVGDESGVLDLARSMLLDLAHSPLTDRVDLVAVGLSHMGDLDGVANVRLADRWADVADELLARADRSRDLLAANRWSSAFVARARSSPRDDLTPIVVVLREVPDDDRFERLCQAVSTGLTTVSVVVLDDAPAATRIEVDGEMLRLPGLGIVCRSQGISEESAERIADTLADAEALPEQLPLLDDVAHARSLAEREVDDDPEILVRLLGEIDVVGGSRPLTPKQTAVVAYIALHAPVAAERIEDAIWTAPTASRRKRMANTVSDCRFALGGEHLPFAEEGRYTVGPGVGTDIELFDRLVAYANDRPLEEAVTLLRKAVELVRGPVFTYRSLDRASYVWIDLENWMTTWELKVADTALQLCELALETGDTETAVWAAQQGLLSLPTHAGLTEALMKAYRDRGDEDAAERVYERHVASLEQLGIDDIAETTIDLRDEIHRSARERESA